MVVYFLYQEMAELEARREFVKLNIARKFSNFMSLFWSWIYYNHSWKNCSNVLLLTSRIFKFIIDDRKKLIIQLLDGCTFKVSLGT